MDLHYLDLLDVSRRIGSRELSPVEVTEAMLRRINEVDSDLKSYVHVTAETALEQARAAEVEITRGRSRGPLHGVPIAIKDLFETAGVKTAAGMPLRRNFIPSRDSTVVERLRSAGAIILGNLKLTEGAHAEHRPPVFEAPVNPWNRELWSGASSSGSGVATAAGLCYGALGTDTGGSIRLPAAVNGVTGLKPTWGRVSRAGVFELAALFDHIGPLARSAADTGAVLGAIAGADPNDPTASYEPVPDYLADLSANLHGLRIGLDEELAFGETEVVVEQSVRAGLEVFVSLGAELVKVEAPSVDAVARRYLQLSGVQTAVAHAETYPSNREEYGSALSHVIQLGRNLSATEYHSFQLLLMDFRSRLHGLFKGIDLLALPVLVSPAPTIKRMAGTNEEVIHSIIRFTAPFSMSGHPTINFPCGFAAGRAPISLQLVGPNFREASLVKAGNAFQQVTDWHKRRPIP
jgi:amidase